MQEQAEERPRPKFLVQGTGHRIMVVSVWPITLGAGIELADSDAGTLSRLRLTLMSAFLWLVVLGARRS